MNEQREQNILLNQYIIYVCYSQMIFLIYARVG